MLTSPPDDQFATVSARLKQRERQLDAIHRVSAALFSATSVEELVRVALLEAVAVADAEVGSFQRYDAASDCLIFQHVLDPAAAHLIGLATPASQGISGQVFRSGTARLSFDVTSESEFNREVDDKTGYQSRSMLTVPVKAVGGTPLGVMQVLNSSRPFTQDDLETLEVLCVYAGNAIETARLAEEARKAQIVNVLGDVSHDIANMVTPIETGIFTLRPWLDKHFSTLQQLAQSGPAEAEWPGAIESSLATVIDDYGWILDNALDAAARVQSRTREIANIMKGELAPPVFALGDVNATAQRVVSLLRPVAQKAQVKLETDLDSGLEAAEIDEKQLFNALYNLVNNAIPETPAGGQIWLRTIAPVANEATFTIQVQDTGRGMPDAVRKRLFTDAAISTKPGGTGLGTRIVAGVVRRHGGTIEVESSPQNGTIFTVKLPFRQSQPAA